MEECRARGCLHQFISGEYRDPASTDLVVGFVHHDAYAVKRLRKFLLVMRAEEADLEVAFAEIDHRLSCLDAQHREFHDPLVARQPGERAVCMGLGALTLPAGELA
jgi:hypothetical protein